MSTGPGTPAAKPPAWKPLGPEQRRVLGVLIEKAKTTPAAYPMSINAIVVGSNQKSNRDPLMAFEDGDVERVVGELDELGVVYESPEVGRVAKYRHRAYEWLGVNRAELAVMTELLLRGAQSLGDLRTRAARMEPIADLAALKPIVDALVQRGLMVELTPAGRGQIVSHNLYKEPERAALKAQFSGMAHIPIVVPRPMPGVTPPVAGPAEPAAHATDGDIAQLRAEVAELRAEVARLRDQLNATTAAAPRPL